MSAHPERLHGAGPGGVDGGEGSSPEAAVSRRAGPEGRHGAAEEVRRERGVAGALPPRVVLPRAPTDPGQRQNRRSEGGHPPPPGGLEHAEGSPLLITSPPPRPSMERWLRGVSAPPLPPPPNTARPVPSASGRPLQPLLRTPPIWLKPDPLSQMGSRCGGGVPAWGWEGGAVLGSVLR